MNTYVRTLLVTSILLGMSFTGSAQQIANPEPLKISEVWNEPAGPNTRLTLNNQLVYSVVLPDGNSASVGDAVYISDADDEDSLSSICFESEDYCTEVAEIAPAPTSAHKVLRLLKSNTPGVSIVELDNLRIVGFENPNSFDVKVGDGITITNIAGEFARTSICVFGTDESIFCTRAAGLNEETITPALKE